MSCWLCSWCILIYLKGNKTWRFVQLPNLVTTSQDRFLYYLSVWKIFSKNSFLSPSQGVSLSIADAKVDTFKLLTKQSRDFFSRKIEEKSQLADFQDYQFYESLQAFSKSAISMLQNIFFRYFPPMTREFAAMRKIPCMAREKIGQPHRSCPIITMS